VDESTGVAKKNAKAWKAAQWSPKWPGLSQSSRRKTRRGVLELLNWK
jgi:hypothetical protein